SYRVGPGKKIADTSVRPLRSTPSEVPCLMRNKIGLAHHPWSITISSLMPYQQGQSILQLQVSIISPDKFHGMFGPPCSCFAGVPLGCTAYPAICTTSPPAVRP